MSTRKAPLALYRAILREHRWLPGPMRQLGNEMVRSEFRLHKNLDPDSKQVSEFLREWEKYYTTLKLQALQRTVYTKNKHQLENLAASGAADTMTSGESSGSSAPSELYGKDLDENQIASLSEEQLEKLTKVFRK